MIRDKDHKRFRWSAAGGPGWNCRRIECLRPRCAKGPGGGAEVSQQAMPVEVTAVGNVEAIRRYRSGLRFRASLKFTKEGDSSIGQLLLTIDSRPYQQVTGKGAIVRDQALQQAEANPIHCARRIRPRWRRCNPGGELTGSQDR
jgi:hypothetical protein